ncbi:hypothetical protein SISNIDRAFT_314926 [Sistotremastrum niveocremeum HHB9708]|uniref:Uncharacterized protein n=2 Tax=Sistotremastraceae TaxID=3402574 RepID=A0A164XZ47_9AGAM|nr:hypothetical protein SISNIDRAFT_314926 [Sistotremastrum niveocremeum HHB9708]KZT40684.1 hypothetical protein SISSUDRAFT_437031 [Sistotremastrum suecicum HHB10207 ss-3]
MMVYVSEQSNLYTDIASLPEELLAEILTTFVEMEMDLGQGMKKIVFPGERKTHSWTKISSVCRQWNRIINHTPGIWSFLDLSWTQEPILRHAKLFKDAPLHIFWDNNNGVGAAESDFMTDNMARVEDLRVISRSTNRANRDYMQFLDLWKTWITVPALHLRLLNMVLWGRGGSHQTISLPNAPHLRHLRLSRCFTKAPFPSSLHTVHISSDARSLNHNDVVRVLSECPQLKSCVFHITPLISSTAERNFVPPFPTHKISLPHLRNMKIGAFSQEILEWIFMHFIPPREATYRLSYTVPFLPEVSFFVPEALKPHASRADSLRASNSGFNFWTEGGLPHSITAHPGGYSNRFTLDPIIGLFPNLSQFYMDDYTLDCHSIWMDGLRRIAHLTLLGICGRHNELAEILGAFSDPTLCPKLEILVLRDLGVESDLPDPDAFAERDDTEAEAHLVKLLKTRDAQNLRIKKLILSRHSYTWANEGNIERWMQHVDAVELMGKPIPETTIES